MAERVGYSGLRFYSPTSLLFFVGQGRQFTRTVRKEDPQQEKNNESVTQNIQREEQKVFGDEVVRILPGNPFEEPLEENLHEVSASICQIGDRPVDSDKSQGDREKREEDSTKNGIPNELATHVGTQPNNLE
jgi:hypothetical protein